MKITRRQLRRIIKEADAAPFGSGMKQADLDKEEKDLIGHTWLTHGKIQAESLREAFGIKGNPVGKIVHHDLERDGTINYYDIKIGNDLFTKVPARMVEAVMTEVHEHEEKE